MPTNIVMEASRKGKKKKNKEERKEPRAVVDADFRLTVERYVRDFMNDVSLTTLEFPNTFTNVHRQFVHKYVQKLGLKSKSHGNGADRKIQIFKKAGGTKVEAPAFIDVTEESEQIAFKLLTKYPLTPQEQEILKEGNSLRVKGISKFRINVAPLSQTTKIHIPPNNYNSKCANQRKNLPIFQYRAEILDTIEKNSVTLVMAETGSGKTTQVPQYIMEEATKHKEECRIVCAQPRRISAISVADRVAYERNEQVGTTVGYQIRLESRLSPNSNLIYCTNGVILRCLMSGNPKDLFCSITHIIIDEVHERDKYTDFLLISIKQYMHLNPNLKVIIMSATIDVDAFVNYFNNCPVMKIPGKLYDVETFYLEDILKLTKFTNKKVEDLIEKFKKNEHGSLREQDDRNQSILDSIEEKNAVDNLDDETRALINETMEEICTSDNPEDAMTQFIFSVESENIPVDIRHPSNGMTVLMIVAGRGFYEYTETLLNMGANPRLSIKTNEMEICAYDIAMKYQHQEVAELILKHIKSKLENPTSQANDNTKLYDKLLLNIYYESRAQNNPMNQMFADDDLDHDLIFKLIKHIHFSNSHNRNAILVFVPGYEDILTLYNLINAQMSSIHDYKVYMLHSKMQTSDQKMVFRPSEFGQRKIILSTNIAETSITIEDVVFVLDCGREKQNYFDSFSNSSSLKLQWISKSSCKQRAGRAGRLQNGFCYRIYSKDRYNHMSLHTIPEILRIPLTEISLQAKLLAAKDMKIEEFLCKAVTPPPIPNIQQSIRLLKDLGALDEDENLTQLGVILADLPVDARLGKMLVYSIIFKCVDPVLTIVSVLSVQDPFVLPIKTEDRIKASILKKGLSENSFSDHLVLLKIFQKWNEFKSERNFDGAFCQSNYISSGLMERIVAARSQIMGQMRSVGLVSSQGNLHMLNKNSDKWFVVKACLAAGLYPNVVKIDRHRFVMKSHVDNKLLVHVSSVLREKAPDRLRAAFKSYPSDYLVFEEKLRNNNINVTKYNTLIHPLVLILIGGSFKMKDIQPEEDSSEEESEEPEESQCNIWIDEFVKFTSRSELGCILKQLRELLDVLVLKFLREVRSYNPSDKENVIIESIVRILENEEKAAGFELFFAGIGARPRGLTLRYNSDLTPDFEYNEHRLNQSFSNLRADGGEGTSRSNKTFFSSNSNWKSNNQQQQNHNDRKKHQKHQKFQDNYSGQTERYDQQQNQNGGWRQNNHPNQNQHNSKRFYSEGQWRQNQKLPQMNQSNTPKVKLAYNSNYNSQPSFPPKNTTLRYFVVILHTSVNIENLMKDGTIEVKSIDHMLQNDAFMEFESHKNYFLIFMDRENGSLCATGKLLKRNSQLCCKFLNRISYNLDQNKQHPSIASILRDVYEFGKKWIEVTADLGQSFLKL